MTSGRDSLTRATLVGSRIGRYDVVAEIGTGGMASVYLARASGSAGFKRLVAIKAMHRHLSSDDAFVEMFLDEARVASTIHHPNVVAIMDVGVEDDLIFLIMEYVEGDSFSNVERVAVQLRRRIPLKIILRVALDSLAGLHNAHELTNHDGTALKIVHRDVSPQNIMVGVDGTSRIVDFGIAKAESRITTTKVGMIKGKLNFMAPEQLRGAPLDRRVDVFGMGVTIWEAVTLRRLFAGESDVDVARKILAGEYPKLIDIDNKLPPAIDDVVRRALAPLPDDRYTTAAEFSDTIESLLQGEIATHREVAAFMAGVAAQKIERERRAIREFGGTQTAPARTSAPEPEVSVDPTDDEHEVGESTVVDSPGMRLAAMRAAATRPPEPARPRAATPRPTRKPTLAGAQMVFPNAPMASGGPGRPPPLPSPSQDDDDADETALISRASPASRGPTAPVAPMVPFAPSPREAPGQMVHSDEGFDGDPAGGRTLALDLSGGDSRLPGFVDAYGPPPSPGGPMPMPQPAASPVHIAPNGVYGLAPPDAPQTHVVARPRRRSGAMIYVFLGIAVFSSVSAVIWYLTH